MRNRLPHRAEAYVDGAVHTSGLENLWSLLKRAIKGTYEAAEEKRPAQERPPGCREFEMLLKNVVSAPPLRRVGWCSVGTYNFSASSDSSLLTCEKAVMLTASKWSSSRTSRPASVASLQIFETLNLKFLL